MDTPVRVGAVNYLNTKPLIDDFERLAPEAELVLEVPSRLADLLADGQLDVALQGASRSSVAALFASDGHWRDLLAFTWTITPCQGADAIAAAMVAGQATAAVRGFTL